MEMAGGLLEQYSGGGAPDAAAVAASGDVDGINKAAFVSLMIKVHFLIIHPPVRIDFNPIPISLCFIILLCFLPSYNVSYVFQSDMN